MYTSKKYNDDEIFNLISQELLRERSTIQLIASENYVSSDVLAAQGSILTNKYAEGYPNRRYYQGCDVIDEVEKIAIERAKKLFKCAYANVQPHSGSQANQAVFLALLKPGDTILSMSLDSGGHLSHGSKVNMSGKWFNVVSYHVDKKSFTIDYDHIESIAKIHNPKMIIAGYSAYPRAIDFEKFRHIADKVGAYLMADIAHIAGIVATSLHSSPIPHAHVVTTTTHKTLRGPRGGMILSNDSNIASKIDSAVFPGLQGGPLMHIIAAKAVAFKEALTTHYENYIRSVLENASVMADSLTRRGYNVLTGGTDNHLLLLDLRNSGIDGHTASLALNNAGIITNKNSVPFDAAPPTKPSGLRLGSPACTTLGCNSADFRHIGNLIADILEDITNENVKKRVINEVTEITKNYNKFFSQYGSYKF